MVLSKSPRQKALWVGLLLMALLVVGCAGIKPYEPSDHREEGPEKGLFTGSEGKFIIFRKVNDPEAGSEADKGSNETADDNQLKMNSEEQATLFPIPGGFNNTGMQPFGP